MNGERLALPWPAWHTDSSGDYARNLSDRALVAAENEHDHFLREHAWFFDDKSGWRVSREQYDAAQEVAQMILYVMRARFRYRVQRSQAAAAARKRIKVLRRAA